MPKWLRRTKSSFKKLALQILRFHLKRKCYYTTNQINDAKEKNILTQGGSNDGCWRSSVRYKSAEWLTNCMLDTASEATIYYAEQDTHFRSLLSKSLNYDYWTNVNEIGSGNVLHSLTTNPSAENEVSKFLTKHKKFPAFVCQEVMDGFAKFWEIKSFWINGEFKYYVAMKAADKVFSESKIYGSNPEEFGKVSPKVLKQIKAMGRKVVDLFPKMNPHSEPPLYLRIDFGCCRDNTMDGESYFLNEVEYAGCAIFTMEGIGKNIFDLWVNAYYKKAKEFKIKGKKTSKKSVPKRTKRRGKKTRRTRRK